MIKWFFRSLLMVTFLLTACASSGGETEATSPQPSGGEPVIGESPKPANVPNELKYIFEPAAEPIGVMVNLEAGQSAETVITSQGGSLSVSGTDGTTYRLDIPAGALVSDTLVRMTPAGVQGMPFGGTTYAVQFEPDGLQLFDFAVLTITPAQELPVDQQIFFGYSGLGEELVIAPPVVDSNEMKVRLLHFSGYGVSKGFLADIEPVRARIGGTAETRLQSAIAEQLSIARQKALLGDETAGSDIDWEGFFKAYEEQVIKPRIAAAGESCAAGRLAIQTILSYERQRQLLGLSEDNLGSSLFDNGLANTVAEVCMKEEYELCRDDHIIHRIIPAWLGLERQYQLLGITEDGASVPALEKAKEYVKRCLTFEMQFHSEGSFKDGDSDGYDSTVESKVKIQFNPATLEMNGSAPLVNTAFEFRAKDCSVTSNRGGSTFEAMSLAIISETTSPTDQVGRVKDFTFIYYPGNTAESFTIQCPDTPPFTSPPSPMWTGIFLPLHQGEMSMAQGGFIADQWEILGDSYFAKKEWIKESAGDGITEVGTLKLYHKPE